MRKCFDQYDTSNDGIITYEEFKLALQQANFSEDELKEIFKSVVSISSSRNFVSQIRIGFLSCLLKSFSYYCQDVNRNGYIQYTEFLAATIEAHSHIEEERIAEAFDRLDSDDTGYISKKNLRDFLGKDATNQEIDALIAQGDENNDGKCKFKLLPGNYLFHMQSTLIPRCSFSVVQGILGHVSKEDS